MSVVLVDVQEFFADGALVTIPDLLTVVSVKVAGQFLAALLVRAPALTLVALPGVPVAMVKKYSVTVAT